MGPNGITMTPPRKLLLLAMLLILAAPPARVLGQTANEPEQQPAPGPVRLALPCWQAADICAEDQTCPGPLSNLLHWGTNDACGKPSEAVFVFFGFFTRGSMGDTADVFNVTYDYHHYIGAVGYQRYFHSGRRHHWGWEVGIGGRFDDQDDDGENVEVWGGPTFRHDGITFFNRLILKVSGTAGFSLVSDRMGHEARREIGRKGDATFLYYLGPEFALSTVRRPNVELFWRLHHRCGGGRTLGNLSEGYNANVIGLRWRF
jgi:hypothetical protein